MSETATRLSEIRTRMAATEKRAGRAAGATRLVAVTKTFQEADILPALNAGQRIFGENRVQEAKAKWPSIRQRYREIELHLIGPLQSNKTGEAVALFDAIQTVDREKIAAELAKEMTKQGRRPLLFVQVNTGEEPQKAGLTPFETPGFVSACRDRHGLSIAGLMCVPPLEENPGPHFALLAKLAAESGVRNLSMGMSGDFETAIEFGATHVRVGTAIFGAR